MERQNVIDNYGLKNPLTRVVHKPHLQLSPSCNIAVSSTGLTDPELRKHDGNGVPLHRNRSGFILGSSTVDEAFKY